MKKYYAVMYNKIVLAGLFRQQGAVAIFAKEDKAQEFCTEMNAITRGYTVEAVRIVKAKKEKHNAR